MIDWQQIRTLCNEIGRDEIEEVVDLFFDEIEEVIERLRSAPNPANLERDLHFLKGSGLNLGFSEFSDLCSQGEVVSARGAAETVAIAPILTAYDDSKRHFLEGYRAALDG